MDKFTRKLAVEKYSVVSSPWKNIIENYPRDLNRGQFSVDKFLRKLSIGNCYVVSYPWPNFIENYPLENKPWLILHG